MHEISPDGQTHVVPGLGGIVLDYKLGDSVDKFVSDHLQPGVTISSEKDFDEAQASDTNLALFTYACLGNKVTIVDAEVPKLVGTEGTIIGKHGGVNYVMAQFEQDVLPKLPCNCEVKIELYGCGLQDASYPDITFMNISPDVLVKMPIKADDNGIMFPVVQHIPAKAMGSGLGSVDHSTDYDIMKPYGANLKIGDFVAIDEHYCKVGPTLQEGAVTIGVIVHGECIDPGHGPGVLPIATCKTTQLGTLINSAANLQAYI